MAFVSFLFAWLALQRVQLLIDASSILVVGDSMGEFFPAQQFEQVCSGTSVTNIAIGGTTASEWASNDSEEFYQDLEADNFSHLWLSVGGNDYLSTSCTASAEQISNLVKAAIQKTHTYYPEAKIVLTGYCHIPNEIEECPGKDVTNLNNGIMTAATDQSVKDYTTFTDVRFLCGAPMSAPYYSDEDFFADEIHLNEYGYCTVFTSDAVQAAFECSQNEDPVVCFPSSANVHSAISYGSMLFFFIIHLLYI